MRMLQEVFRRGDLHISLAREPAGMQLLDVSRRTEQRTCADSPAHVRNRGEVHRASSPPVRWQVPLFNSISESNEIGSGTGSSLSIASMRRRTSFLPGFSVSIMTRRTFDKRGSKRLMVARIWRVSRVRSAIVAIDNAERSGSP